MVRKIWEKNTSNVIKLFAANKFNHYRRVIVVAANPDTILNTNQAPKEIKYKILRADTLVKQIEYDFNHRESDEILDSQKKMEELAKSYVNLSIKDKINYYEFYKNKYCNNDKKINKEELKERLIGLRTNRSKEMNIPAYYVFTNDELDKLLELMPRTIEELKESNILTPVKIKAHGKYIINTINNKNGTTVL